MSYTVESEIAVSENQDVFEIKIYSSDQNPLTLQEVYDAFLDTLFTYYGVDAMDLYKKTKSKLDS